MLRKQTQNDILLPETTHKIFRNLWIPIFLTIFIISGNLYSQQNGIISGKVVDSETGEELIGANIILKGTTNGAASDIEGNYIIRNVNPDTYVLIASMIGYSQLTVTDLEIKPGSTANVDIKLFPEAYETEEVVVTAKMILDNEFSLLKNRQKSITVSDAIGSDLISRSGSDDVGDALKKVVGTSVVDGKYVYVRGLGDRYSNTQLNGAELPSSDPNRKSFQMDLIPTNLLDNIVTIKTFTPDRPGNFSGGIVDIGTKSFPDKFTFKLSGSSSYNTQSTGNSNFLTYPGSGSDWFGTDDGMRSIPDVFTNPDLVIPTEPEARFDDEKAATLNDISTSFNPFMANTKSAPPINSSLSLSVGDQISLGDVSSFGYLGSLTYKRSFDFYENGRVERYTLSDINSDLLNPQLILDDSKGTSEAVLGGLFTAAFNINPEHQIGGNVFYSRSGISKSRFMEGQWPQEIGFGPEYRNIVLEWMERDILSYQVRGDHQLSGFLNSKVDWSVSFANTTQSEPDRRLTTYITTNTSQGPSYTINGSNFDNPSRYFRDLEDNTNTYNLNLSIPFTQWSGFNGKIKIGGMYQTLDRKFEERIFTYSTKDDIFNNVDGKIDQHFQNENNGIVDTTQLGDRTRYFFGNTIYDRSFPKNNYTGDQTIYAGYGMIDLPIFQNLRFIGGLRYETTDMSVLSKDPTIEEGKIVEKDILPSVTLIYNLTENMNLRFAGTQTLARPTFREIAPYSTKQFVNDEELVGNANLKRTLIENYDLRWEWFLRPGEIIAVSGFYKKLKNPIERAFSSISSASNKIVTYTNVEEARILGAEFEFRTGLSYIADFLSNFSVGFNLSLVNSTIDIPRSELNERLAIDSSSSTERQLQGQSPYTINVDLTYNNDNWGTVAGLYFNTFGERLSTVSANLTPDVFEQPANILNFTLSQKVIESFYFNLGVKNILNAEIKEVYRFKGKDYIYQSYTMGRKISVGITYKI
ncbi:MAG: TonB-dependent receptor [Ignavibacteria bacterium]|jgi:outer membrane receptor protein involved in Fe transport